MYYYVIHIVLKRLQKFTDHPFFQKNDVIWNVRQGFHERSEAPLTHIKQAAPKRWLC